MPPASGAARYAHQSENWPARIIGPIARAGLTPAPLIGPLITMATALPEPLSQAEARILRFLQTSLSAPEIASELYVSVNTVRTHMRHVYDKPDAHRRLEAIDRARALGLLAPVPQKGPTLVPADR
jgi:DNA-binding CsgD family transcriptional regulator